MPPQLRVLQLYYEDFRLPPEFFLPQVFEGNRKTRNYIVFFFHRTVLFSFLYQDGMTVTVKLFDISLSVLFLERTLQPLSC